MANRYWVTGGTGDWNSTTNWSATTGGASGASVPGSADTAAFDANSGSGTVTLDISPTIQTLNCTGFTGTLAFGTNTITLNATGTIFTGSTTMTVTGTPLIILTNNSATARTIIPGVVTEANSISFRITAGTGTLSITTGAVRDLDFTDGTNPTGYAGAAQNMIPTIYGNFKASTGMTKVAGTGTFTFAATSGIKTINTGGVVFDNPFAFSGVGGTWQLQDALTSGSNRACTLTAGTLDLNNQTLTIGTFNSTNANTRTLAFGSNGFINLTSASTTGNVTIFSTSDSTNFTVTGTDPLVNVEGGSSGFIRTISTGLISSGGSASNAISFSINSGSDTISIGTANRVFKDILFVTNVTLAANAAPQIYGSYFNGNYATITGGTNAWTFKATSGTKVFLSGSSTPINNPVIFDGVGGVWQIFATSTINGEVTLTNGTLQIQDAAPFTVNSFNTSGTNRKYLQSTSAGNQATISAASGTNSVSYLTIQDSNATGGATWYATGSTNVDAGNNSGWIFFPTPADSNEITMRLRSFTQPRRF